MFQRFTDRARRAVVLAQEEARMLNHGYIGTEHLLLGLVHEGEGVAARALESLGISLQKVRDEVEALIGQGKEAPPGHIPFTPRAKKVLELSLREANQLGHNYIGTEHILLGIIREGQGVAAKVLVKLGAELPKVRKQVIELLQVSTGELHGQTFDVRAQMHPSGLGSAVLEEILGRLSALERWVGLGPDTRELDENIATTRGEKDAAIESQDFEKAAALRATEKRLLAAKQEQERQWAESLTGRPPLSAEFGRLGAELARLRGLLREHGIEPGDAA